MEKNQRTTSTSWEAVGTLFQNFLNHHHHRFFRQRGLLCEGKMGNAITVRTTRCSIRMDLSNAKLLSLASAACREDIRLQSMQTQLTRTKIFQELSYQCPGLSVLFVELFLIPLMEKW